MYEGKGEGKAAGQGQGQGHAEGRVVRVAVGESVRLKGRDDGEGAGRR